MQVQLHFALTILVLILTINSEINTFTLKLTKLICNSNDKTFAIVKTCRLKAESRSLQYYTVYWKFLKLPITDMDAHIRFLKRGNGYKPFLYDFHVKCDFIKKLNPITSIIWGWFKDKSNLNHSCPLVEDFEIKRLENRYIQDKLQALPIPPGDYCFVLNITMYGKYILYGQYCGIISA